MSRSDRSFLAPAIFGLIATSAGLGSWATASWSDKQEDYPHYTEATNQQAQAAPPPSVPQAVQPLEQRKPCSDQRSREDSDLCAQWRAAKAGESASDWAYLQLWLSLGGVIGLALTLWFNWRALRVASQSNDEARLIGEAQTRAYLTIEGLNLRAFGPRNIWVELTLTNSGSSPALKVQTNFAFVEDLTEREFYLGREPGRYDHMDTVPASSSKVIEPFSFTRPSAVQDTREQLRLSIMVYVKYIDVFGKRETLRAHFASQINPEGTNATFWRLPENDSFMTEEQYLVYERTGERPA